MVFSPIQVWKGYAPVRSDEQRRSSPAAAALVATHFVSTFDPRATVPDVRVPAAVIPKAGAKDQVEAEMFARTAMPAIVPVVAADVV